ncbi:hypothetical protein [Micromonospora sp. WMMD987]|uniref:hypothetical protein n=1 Tax=Micromonospora TaxID=1873 RepID=UPI00249CA132|nr:hypothetical protein [Micromonospora sp. WMMD987]WFE95219.1 hypothetical protein O7612_28610 [Micromonospora sp. WMMD987]
MRLRQPAGTPHSAPDLPLRILVITAVSALFGMLAWQEPGTVNPMLTAVAVYAVLDRLTDRRPDNR